MNFCQSVAITENVGGTEWNTEHAYRRTGAFRMPFSGTNWSCDFPDMETLPMFKVPAYDPVGIAIMGFGILL